MKKKLTEEQKSLLTISLKVINEAIDYYEIHKYNISMCGTLGSIMTRQGVSYYLDKKIILAFMTTKPYNTYDNYLWYKQGSIAPRLKHLKRIKKDILLYL